MRQRGQHADAKTSDDRRCSIAPKAWAAGTRAALACALCLSLGLALPAHAHQQQAPPPHYAPHPAPQPRPGPPPAASPGNRSGGQYRDDNQRQNHLGDWLQKHQNMSRSDQENAFRREPGFSRLPPDQQQRLIGRLQQLNNLPPDQRQRTLGRMEAMERLSPPQREEVRQSAMELGLLPPDRQRMLRKAFRDLRDMPVEQRDSVLNSPRFQSQFSRDERHVLGTLLQVEPYQGGAAPPGTVPAGR